MDEKKRQTVNTYNRNAEALANKFDDLPVRLSDIDETFDLVKKKNPKVLEIGCGNGRDAVEICKRTNDYLGVDISEKLIRLARKKVPQGKFEVADIETFAFPPNLNIIFAFASLVHSPKEALSRTFDEIHDALDSGGVFRLSMKWNDRYSEVTKEDEFGIRTYFFYSLEDIKELGRGFVTIKNELLELRGQTWLEVLFQKPTKA